jgi:hypothetical protein
MEVEHLLCIPEFVILLFDRLGDMVGEHAVTVSTLFEDTSITTDDSIGAI